MPDPIEPGHIPGQNANTPERLHGQMDVGSRNRPWLIAAAAIVSVTLIAIALIYGTMAIDPGTAPQQ